MTKAHVWCSDRSVVAKSRATIEGSSAFCQVRGLNLAPHRNGDDDEWSLESSFAPRFCRECCMGEYGANECRYQEPRKPATHKVVDQSHNPDVIKLNFFKRHFRRKKYVKMDAIRTLLDGADVWWLRGDTRSQLLARFYKSVTESDTVLSDNIEGFIEEEDAVVESNEDDVEEQLNILSFEEEDKANGVDEMAVVHQEERSEMNQTS
jgi:hypothetical protein